MRTFNIRSALACASAALLVLVPVLVSAHEAYVLPQPFFWSELSKPFSLQALQALYNPENVRLTFIIAGCTLLGLLLNFFFRRSRTGERVSRSFEKFAPYGPLFVRAAIAAAFFYSALSWSFLGPELPLMHMPFAHVLRVILFAASVMIALGFLTELAAFAALIVFCIGFKIFGLYVATYLNYLGEILVLLFFGMRKWSVDGLLFGSLKRFPVFREYGTSIVRVFYGLALMYAAVTVKFLHPALTVEVVNHWNLTQFHWLFPHDPLLVTLGAGIVECVIGFFILVGFEMRLTILVSLFYITLSLLYFRELVWPHLMLYGISFNLLFEPELYTVDNLLFGRSRKKKLVIE